MHRDLELALIDRLLAHVEADTRDLGPAMVQRAVAEYIDPVRFSEEREALFRDHPVVVGHTAQLAGPGSFFTHDHSGVPIVVTRNEAGAVQAFLNVCRHRGGRATNAPCGTSRRLTCAFHGWTYDLDGRLRGLPLTDGFDGLDRERYGLVPLPVAERHGLIVVRPRPGARQLIDSYGWRNTALLLAAFVATLVLFSWPIRGKAVEQQGQAAARAAAAGPAVPLSQELRRAFHHRSYLLLNAAFFVCGFHVTFIATHLVSYAGDAGVSRGAATLGLSLIGLFNIIGSLLAGYLGSRRPKTYLLSAIYALRGVIITGFVLVPPQQCHRRGVRHPDRSGVAVHRAAHQRHRGRPVRHNPLRHPVRLRVPVPSDRGVHRRLDGRTVGRPHRQLPDGVVDRHRPRRPGCGAAPPHRRNAGAARTGTDGP